MIYNLPEETILVQDIEHRLLLQAIYERYGYDFREYSKASSKRRVLIAMEKYQFESISHMQSEVLSNGKFFEKLIQDLTLTVTELFRHPSFYIGLREYVVSYLKTYPQLKIWIAGCATGQEAYSVAIFLKEMELYDQSIIYATDLNQHSIDIARKGIYSIEVIKKGISNYLTAGGQKSLNNYLMIKHGHAMFNPSLKKNIVFSSHNLANDHYFGEMNLIFCQNVLIYFNKTLQEKVLNLFYESLGRNGILCIGPKESLLAFSKKEYLRQFDPIFRIYQKK